MVIKRNNYEEYFLLYTDEELTPSERQMVELFVQQNADLGDELELLLLTKLDCDNTILVDKSSLYKHTGFKIDESNYEEQFLLYIDDELTETDRNEVEIFLVQNPAMQKNFEALKHTKLIPEKIVFTNKEVLYKKKKTTVLFISWSRVAVAAIFIGLLLLTWSLLTPNKIKNTIAVASPPLKTINTYPKTVMVSPLKHTETATVTTISKKLISKSRKISKSSKQQINSETPVHNDFNVEIKEEKPIPDTKNKETAIAMIIPENKTIDRQDFDISKSQQLKNISINADNDSKKINQRTVYKVLDTEDAINNTTIYVGNFQINKDRLAGLLKRASHIFNKAADEGNSIAIANFTINKSLR